MEELPLFQLHSVLYPRLPMRLHVFEPRYQEMVADCGPKGHFGVVAIRRGSEVGGSAEPHALGTVASIERQVRLSRGRRNLTVVGGQRFRIMAVLPDQPYPRAQVAYVEEAEPSPGDFVLAGKVAIAFSQYLGSLAGLTGYRAKDVRLPDDPELLSWTVAAGMVVETSIKQQLLEAPSVGARLRSELALLRREVTLLGLQMANRMSSLPGYNLN